MKYRTDLDIKSLYEVLAEKNKNNIEAEDEKDAMKIWDRMEEQLETCSNDINSEMDVLIARFAEEYTKVGFVRGFKAAVHLLTNGSEEEV